MNKYLHRESTKTDAVIIVSALSAAFAISGLFGSYLMLCAIDILGIK